MPHPVRSFGVLLAACYWFAAGPLVPVLQATLCPPEHHQMAGMPSGPCYCAHMAGSLPIIPADAVVQPILTAAIRVLPPAPVPRPTPSSSRSSPTYPPEPPPPNTVA